MTGLIHLQIGGIEFTISSKSADIHHGLEPAYQTFFKVMDTTPKPIRIDVHLKLKNMPDTKKLTKIFDSRQSWSMFRDHHNYWLALQPPVYKKPLWLARFTKDIKTVTVFCGEKLINRKDRTTIVSNPVRYPLDQLLMMYILAKNRGVLIHAAGICINKKALIFPGQSGAGKSTLSRQFTDCKDLELLSDDRIIVRKINHTYMAFGTPWPGEEGIANNKSTPLSGIYFLCHGEKNNTKKLKPQDAVDKFMQVTSIPWYDQDIFANILDFCRDLVHNIPVFELSFKPDKSIVNFVKGLQPI